MKKSLSLNHQTTSFIDLTFPCQYSKAVNTHMNDYQLCLIDSIIHLTEEEWLIFINMNNKYPIDKKLPLPFQFMRYYKVLNHSDLSDGVKELIHILNHINLMFIIMIVELKTKHPDHSIDDLINMI